ncbi:hypothetical protein [Kineococcus rhizosphaerae]|uniref:Uncharacterized protein n=1 Tax=Kineococcus rhizosphaerae TaxID=559628 RepID=A0A2T0R7Z2_9ACTN|nr:hypothetical protein [Kineococcus rhizosphaerae]PRY17281.1 hypothetical protein CLV37_102240 [Kineococcus rhizosphaerae]
MSTSAYDGARLTVVLAAESEQEHRCLAVLRRAGLEAAIERVTPTGEDPVVVVAVPCEHRPTSVDVTAATVRVTRELQAAGLHAEVCGTGFRSGPG